MTYVPNTIRILTHEADFSHQELGFGERTQNHQWSHEERRRKEERKRGGRKRKGGTALFCPRVTSGWLARFMKESRRLTWHDSIDVAQCSLAWHGRHALAP
jgi:hypothetical protein